MRKAKVQNIIDQNSNNSFQSNSSNLDEELPISSANSKKRHQYESVKKSGGRVSDMNASRRRAQFAYGTILIILIAALILMGVYIKQNFANKAIEKSYLQLSQSNLGLTAIFFIVNDDHKALQSIDSFLKNNLCNRIIIASHKNLSHQAGENLKDATWAIERRPEYDLYFVDELIKKVDTQFFFLATTEWEYYDNSFVDFSIKILKQYHEIVQVLPNLDENKFANMNSKHEGFSFLPGVHRKKDYLSTKDGYTAVCGNVRSLKEGEQKISAFYLSKGFYMLLSAENFNIFKIGTKPQILLEPEAKGQEKKSKTTDTLKRNKNQYGAIFNTDKHKEKVQDMKNVFLSSYHNALHFLNFQQYLTHNKAQKILLINCDQACRSDYSKASPQGLSFESVNHISDVLNSNVPEVYDWISSQNLEGFVSNIIQKNIDINLYTNFGVSLRWPLANYGQTAIDTIIEYFNSKGFHYDEAKSLNFRKVEEKIVMIFIKGQKQVNLIKPKLPENKNMLGIQTVFKMKENLFFLREWMIYHINLGFEKFYLYDNSNSAVSEVDSKSSKTGNKFGMSFDCIQISDQEVRSVWRYIWTEFYEYIVYVKWEPKDEQGRIIYGQVKSQQDYLYHYKDVVKYTLFIDIDELIFSPGNKELIPFLNFYSDNKISSLKLRQRRFLNRFCVANKRMSEIFQYFPEDSKTSEGVKVIAETSSFFPRSNIQEEKTTQGRQIVVAEEQFRINHYSFEKDGMEQANANGYNKAWQFQTDNGVRRYRQILNNACNGKCSQIFSISCPAGQLWPNCLDISKVHLMHGNSNIIASKSQPEGEPKSYVQRKKPTYIPSKTQPSTNSNTPKPTPPTPSPTASPTPMAGANKLVLGQFLTQVQTWLKTPAVFYQFDLLREVKELPICLVLIPSLKYSQDALLESIKTQGYSNYRQFTPPAEQNGDEKINYFYYKEQILEKCAENALIMFISVPLKAGALKYVNENLQKYHAWVAYTKDSKSIEVVAFFYRIYDLLSINDFKKTNEEALKTNNKQIQTVGLLELCVQYNKQLEKQKIVNPVEFTYFSALRTSRNVYDRIVYTRLIRLSQDIDISVGPFQRTRGAIGSLKVTPVMKLSTNHMFRASDRQQQWYLPEGHTIQQREFEQYSDLYKINEYADISKQVRFCVTILSHNNIQNNRYIKVMKSIVMQKYENYHIVFIDDNSDDNNMNGTIDYMKSINFPQDRIVYIQNKRRNYATYNIINAAYNYCHEDDVQMLMDGDDQFVGKYAFQVMNSAYQQQSDLFFAYSNYKTNYYGFGRSRGLYSEFDHAANGRRAYMSVFGPIRTWKTKVVYNIPMAHHKMQDGEWLDTVYDDALSHPLFELASVKRSRYIPEILYDYNIRYGDNDDSTSAKIKHRGEAYKHVLSLPLLSQLQNLDRTVMDAEIYAELKGGDGVRYEEIKP